MGAPLRTDVHQHLWPVELLDALAARGDPPFARRDGGFWRLQVPGEPPSVIVAQEPGERAASLVVDRALLSLSTALEVGRLEARRAPLFVHPGPAHDPDHDGAPWWPALTPNDDARLRENPERLLG
ncbi:MAG: 6-methylsalicylate decarboxylase [Solirubrobacteraceae bacterium]